MIQKNSPDITVQIALSARLFILLIVLVGICFFVKPVVIELLQQKSSSMGNELTVQRPN